MTYSEREREFTSQKSNTHKIRRNFKTKYNDNKRSSDQYLVYIPRLILPKEFLNDNNDSKLTIFETLKMFSHINTTMVDEQFIGVSANCSIVATQRLQRKITRHVKIY